jgi:hypothetical protein
MEWSAHCNTEDVRWVLRERPLILDGPDPRAFACEIPATVRMLYTLERGEVISKPQALAWATRTMPAEWRDLIAHVREDRFVQWNDPPRPGSVERSLAFVAYVQKRARSSP